jgi:hypothetical protein
MLLHDGYLIVYHEKTNGMGSTDLGFVSTFLWDIIKACVILRVERPKKSVVPYR